MKLSANQTFLAFTLMLLIFTLLSSCTKEYCISCIAQDPQNNILENRVACGEEGSTEGFEDGFRFKYRDRGDTVSVICSRDFRVK